MDVDKAVMDVKKFTKASSGPPGPARISMGISASAGRVRGRSTGLLDPVDPAPL